MDTTVKNDTRENIGRDETVSIGRDRTETIRRRHCQKILAEKDVWIGGGYNTQVFAEMNEFVVISRSEETLGFKTEYVGAHCHEEIRRTKKQKIGRDYTIDVGRNVSETVSGEKAVKIKKTLTECIDADHLETVKHKYQVHAETIEFVASQKIVLKVGDTVLTLDPSLLTGDSKKTEWLGSYIKVDSRGDLDISAMDKLDMNSLEFKLRAGSDGEIKGSVVKINC
jgi:type VI secretion system secreted protein VgrG